MEYYVVGLGIASITIIVLLSLCACFCRINVCEDKKEKIPLIYTSIQT